MRIDVITIFPNIFEGFLGEGMVRIASEKGLVSVFIHDLRNFTANKHRQVDDLPYGGGAGMVMKPEPFYEAVASIGDGPLEKIKSESRIAIFTPRGRLLKQDLVEELAAERRLILLCGRYEGVDERVHELIATDEISVGDYVLSGGEVPAMLLIEAVTRLIPGVLGGEELSLEEESFADGLLEYPHYTRPAKFLGVRVPEVLLSGHHGEIAKWRRRERLKATLLRRPDLLESAPLSDEDRQVLAEIERELGF